MATKENQEHPEGESELKFKWRLSVEWTKTRWLSHELEDNKKRWIAVKKSKRKKSLENVYESVKGKWWQKKKKRRNRAYVTSSHCQQPLPIIDWWTNRRLYMCCSCNFMLRVRITGTVIVICKSSNHSKPRILLLTCDAVLLTNSQVARSTETAPNVAAALRPHFGNFLNKPRINIGINYICNIILTEHDIHTWLYVSCRWWWCKTQIFWYAYQN
jgi:hypothetical protein